MAALVDTNILVYLFDPSAPWKQQIAEQVVYRGLADGSLVLSHQALVEFVSATTRPRPAFKGGGPPLLDLAQASREVEELTAQFPVLYPNDGLLITALRGAATYGLSWYDAHIWAYAEFFGLDEIFSEDFEHGRVYGSVRVVDPFLATDMVNEPRAVYGEG